MMQTALQRAGHVPYSLFAAAGIFLLAVTAYPKSLDESASCGEKTTTVNAQCVTPAMKGAHTPHR